MWIYTLTEAQATTMLSDELTQSHKAHSDVTTTETSRWRAAGRQTVLVDVFPAAGGRMEGASISLQPALTLKWSAGKQEVSLYHSHEFHIVSCIIY
ncbi:hypothetical protein NQZ68_029664 [Dissostichus eleginoides]|nr:hypothetical protein NQZ68_029664 [Dissostichus eleginoides]